MQQQQTDAALEAAQASQKEYPKEGTKEAPMKFQSQKEAAEHIKKEFGLTLKQFEDLRATAENEREALHNYFLFINHQNVKLNTYEDLARRKIWINAWFASRDALKKGGE